MRLSNTILLLYSLVTLSACNSDKTIKEEAIAQAAKENNVVLNGTDELSSTTPNRGYSRSEYNEDLIDIENIKRPEKSIIDNPTIDTASLFQIWVRVPGENEPHATFVLSKEDFYIVDYDGDGSMLYVLTKDSIEVYYNDFKKKGKIISVDDDSLIIKWEQHVEVSVYEKWKW